MTGIIILAAGASSRMGQPKQQLVYEQKTLLQRSVDTALSVLQAIVLVVLGANAEAIKTDIADQPVQIIDNIYWETGMSSSIKAAINALINYPDVDDALLMLCDQPFVDVALLKQLISHRSQTHDYIIACQYGDTLGVPALFSKYYFDELLALDGQEGAKKVLMKHKQNVITIPFEKGNIDIDTPADFNKLTEGRF